MEYSFRDCTLEDFDFLFNLKKENFKWYVDKIWGWKDDDQQERLRQDLKEHLKHKRIILIDNKPVGVYAVHTTEIGDLFINEISIVKEYQGKGIGRKILEEQLKENQKNGIRTTLQVFKDNPAKKLYEQLGFKVYGETETHYQMENNYEYIDKTEVTIETYNNIVEEYIDYYNSKELNGNVQFQKEIDYLISQLHENATILDAGTAIGDYPKFLTEKCDKNFNVIGIDTSENMLKKAIKNAPKAKFELMDIRDIKFNKNNFNAIICFATLIHVNDETCLKVLDKFNELLKDEGLIAINVMECNNEEKEIFIREPFNPKYKTYFNRYKKQFFIDYFTANNYTIEKIYDNKMFDESAVGEDLTGTNEFTIIVRKNKKNLEEENEYIK